MSNWCKLSAKELLVLPHTLPALHTNNGGASKVQPITSENFSRFEIPTKAKMQIIFRNELL
jgi:hypothetical protein